MFKKFFLLFFPSLFLFAKPADDQHGSLEGEFLYLHRNQTHDKPLISKGLQLPTQLLDMRDSVHHLGYAPACKITARLLSKCSLWEFAYLFRMRWSSSEQKTSAFSDLYFSPGEWKAFHDFSLADKAQVKLSFAFEDAEINHTSYIPKRATAPFAAYWLTGLRYLFVNEDLKNFYTRSGGTSCYKVGVDNQIYALEAGAGLLWNPTEVWGWDVFGKVGTGVNIAKQKTWMTDYNNSVVLRNFSKKELSWPLLVDLSIRLKCNFTQHFGAFLGYQMLYLSSLALSVDQLVYTAQYKQSIKTTGDMIISGGFGGLNFSF